MKQTIKFHNIYSLTDKPDNKGRWEVIVVRNNITIAWIGRIEQSDKEGFIAYCHFPTMNNNTAKESKICATSNESKEFVKERWEWFLKKVC